jgi:hypothetical protein
MRAISKLANGFATVAFVCCGAPSRGDDHVTMFGDANAIAQVQELRGHKGEVSAALFLPDGGLLTAGVDGSLRVWDVDSGEQRQLVSEAGPAITRLMGAPDGRRILAFTSTGTIRVFELPLPKRGWGPEQAVGPPDASQGDDRAAWASATPDGQVEWLLVEYAEPVKPIGVRVYENFNPGAITKVLGYDSDGDETTLWEASDADEPKSWKNWREYPVETDVAVKRVKLVIDSPRVAGWNEIDAVALVDANRKVHWATRAGASSTYGERHVDLRGGQVVERPRMLPPPVFRLPAGAKVLSHVDDTAEGKHSFGGSGHAIRFKRPAGASRLAAIEVFGSRYGMPQPPDEDFHVYVLDRDGQVLHDLVYPYAMFERGDERWVVLGVDELKVPREFSIALDFNARQTKGVYVGKDESVEESHSSIGTPSKGFEPVDDKFDWMIRVHLTPDGDDASRAEVRGGDGAMRLARRL